MKRFQCMQALGGRLQDELVILSLGASVDEWYNAAPHMRAASLFQQQLGCVTPQAFGLAVGLPHRRVVSLDTDGGMLFNLGILSSSGTTSVTSRSAGRRRIRPAGSTSPPSPAAPASSMLIQRRMWPSSTRIAPRD
jgi:hypothetical protein